VPVALRLEEAAEARLLALLERERVLDLLELVQYERIVLVAVSVVVGEDLDRLLAATFGEEEPRALGDEESADADDDGPDDLEKSRQAPAPVVLPACGDDAVGDPCRDDRARVIYVRGPSVSARFLRLVAARAEKGRRTEDEEEGGADRAQAGMKDLVAEEVGREGDERAEDADDGPTGDEHALVRRECAEDGAADEADRADDGGRASAKVVAGERVEGEEDEGGQVARRADDAEPVPSRVVEVGVPGRERLQAVHVAAVVAEGESCERGGSSAQFRCPSHDTEVRELVQVVERGSKTYCRSSTASEPWLGRDGERVENGEGSVLGPRRGARRE